MRPAVLTTGARACGRAIRRDRIGSSRIGRGVRGKGDLSNGACYMLRRAYATPTGPASGPSSSQTGFASRRYLRIGAVTAVIGLTAWATSSTAAADAGSGKPGARKGDSVPDAVHSSSGKSKGKSTDQGGQVSIRDVLAHRDGDEVWVVIKGGVYDMTEFLDDHPGGKDIIMNNRSKDVTPIFNPRHPSDQLDPDNIPPNVHHLGSLDLEAATDDEKSEIRLKVSAEEEDENERIAKEREAMEKRGLGVIVNMRDFEKYAEPMISKVAWAYYASAADDEITKNTNASAYQKVVFRPRILRKVAEADCSTEILGKATKIPVFISPAAMAKLGHPDGEVNLTKGAHNTGIIQIISSNASCSLDELCAVRQPSQPLFFQLYVNRNRSLASDLIKKLNKLDLDAIFLTGDAPVGGKRERDLRLKGEFEGPAGGVAVKSEGGSKGVSEAMFAGVDPDLNWEDIAWIKSLSDKPIIVKGVQCVEDALMAYEKGASGILISNHGGRQLDTTRPSLDVLLEIRKHAPHLLRQEYRGPPGLIESALKSPEKLVPREEEKTGTVMDKEGKRPFEVYVDGGISRGTDVVKALCLGANAVGVGRGFLYAQSVAGVEGVEHAVGILQEEILLTMRLLGVNKLSELRPSMVEVRECKEP